ncbi:hypothetical protein CVT26_013992 [Gymnopilus dilepis]|uniref:Uncharacterized protein n=1 Tax=Gymnopilus dilepis TaxID=231916 RepID=A0A409VW44_9AGAR|nr:hypothetical protein CVT26_013992 [Gymnopilus dilepis]
MRRRYKRPKVSAFQLEQARRKWEKNRRRVQARRLAKLLAQRNVMEEGSEGPGDYLASSGSDVPRHQGVPHTPVPAISTTTSIEENMIFQESGRELPPASTTPTPDISSSGSCPATSTSDLSSLERMLSRLFPLEDLNATSLEPSSIISLEDSLESETPDTSWGGKDAPQFLSNASVCPKLNNATMPSLPSTSVRRSSLVVRPAFASQACVDISIRNPSLRRLGFFPSADVAPCRPSSKTSSIFIEPLDFSQSSNKRPSLTRSGEALGTSTYRFPARQPLSSDYNLNGHGPPNFLGYSFSCGRSLAMASTALSEVSESNISLEISPDESASIWGDNSDMETNPLLIYTNDDFNLRSSPSALDDTDIADVDDLFRNAPVTRHAIRTGQPFSGQSGREKKAIIENCRVQSDL